MRLSLLALASVSLLVACRPDTPDGSGSAERQPGASATPPAAGAGEPLAPARVSRADLAGLRWLEGRWRGSGGSYPAFYEQYAFSGDSAIVKRGYPDSTFATPGDSSVIRLRGDSLLSESERTRYLAIALAADSVVFAPLGNAANGFIWRRTSDTTWLATLTQSGRAVTEYRMTRIGR